jgi:signal peptidase II
MKSFFQKHLAFLSVLLFAVLVALDQWTKALAVQFLKNQDPYVIWDGVFEFHYFENTGAAWGMLQNQQVFFYILTVIFGAVVLYEIHRLKQNPRYTTFIYTLSVMMAGAVGNFIDRISQKYVVDFIYVKLINFPIFNLADCYITVSVIAMMLLILFYYSDDEFEFIFPVFTGKNKKDK